MGDAPHPRPVIGSLIAPMALLVDAVSDECAAEVRELSAVDYRPRFEPNGAAAVPALPDRRAAEDRNGSPAGDAIAEESDVSEPLGPRLSST